MSARRVLDKRATARRLADVALGLAIPGYLVLACWLVSVWR
jgi:hypothetical protein